MATGAKTIQWRILIWLLPLQILIFAGFQVWLESHLSGAAELAGPTDARDPPAAVTNVETDNGQVRAVRIATASTCLIVLLLTLLTIRLQLDRHLSRPLAGILARAAADRAGEPRQPLGNLRHPELTALAAELDHSAQEIDRQQREIQENERLVTVGQMVAGLSHTLKNMLNGLRAGQFVLDRALKTGDEEKLQKGIRVTRRSVRRIERLIFDMLHFAKDRDPHREPLDPNDIIREVSEELRRLAGSWNVDLSTDLDDVGTIALDRLAIYRVLVDLTTNAIEACTEGGPGDLVVLGSRSTPGEVVLTVADNGIGMTQDVLDNLYTRFVSTKSRGGTGLGMVVVKQIVDEHEGEIEVESTPGEGTTFRIHLKRMSAQEAAG